jgi:hypothetical protein
MPVSVRRLGDREVMANPLVKLAAALDRLPPPPREVSVQDVIARKRERPGERAAFRKMFSEWEQGTKRLADGSVGYYIQPGRADDCWRAAVATCVQVPPGEVPDPHLDERMDAGETPEEINRSACAERDDWLAELGLRLVIHGEVPVPRRRWVGVIPRPGWFQDHCLVMCRGEVLWDPNPNLPFFADWTAADVKWGFSFQKTATVKRS